MTTLGFARNLDGYADVYADLQLHVHRRTRALLEHGRARLAALDTPAAAARHAERVIEAVRAGLGGLPADVGSPPPTQWGEVLDTGSHTVQRLTFAPLPGGVVTANLYRPPGAATGPRPAVLFVCGHTPMAKADPTYQAVCIRLVRAGFVVLAIDPFGQGERLGYLRPDGTEVIAGGTAEHTYAGLPGWWLGLSTARWFVHEARRALDLLAGLPDVDPARMGITGNSGGGTLATLTMVTEPRLAAAAIGTYLTSRGAYLGTGQRQDVEQILLDGTAAGVDHADLLAAMAPRPVTVLAADYDFFPIEGTVDSVELARGAYDLLGAADALRLVRAATTHDYARELAEAAVAFFTDVLDGHAGQPTQPADPSLAVLPEETLRCTETGQVALELPGTKFLHDLIRDEAEALTPPPTKDAVAWLRDRVLADREPPARTFVRWLPGPAGSRHAFWRSERDLWGAGVLLPADRTPTDGPRPLHLVLLEQGTETLTDTHPLTGRDDQRELVLALDVRGVGALAPYDRGGLPQTDQSSASFKLLCDLVFLGDSLAAGRVYDVLRAVEVLRHDPHLAADFPGLGPDSPVHLHGEGTGAFPALLAAAVDPTITKVYLRDEVVDPERMLRQRYYDEGRGSWQWVLPGLARHAPLPALCAILGDRLVHLPATTATGLHWHAPGPAEGKGWARTERPYDRLPLHARGRVPDPVWQHSRCPSGMFVRFRTDSTQIWARWSVRNRALGMWHMAPAAVSGIDLYGRDAGAVRWLGVSRPVAWPANEGPMVEGLSGAMREYVAYLPLFNPLERLEIGVDPGAAFEPVLPDPRPPIVYYGTSIVHGAAASRPGMSLPAQLGRRLDRTVIGLGFSGVGRMERALAELLGELDPAAFVVDCLPNMPPDLVAERAREFLVTLRAARPATPVLLVEDRTYTDAWAVESRRRRNEESRAVLRRIHTELADPAIHYLAGEALLGDDGEATVDASHPTDLGFTRMADVLTAALQPILSPELG